MLLAIDIGNSNIVVGIFRGRALKDHFRVASNRNLTADEAGLFLTGLLDRLNVPVKDIDTVVIGSVVPPLTSVFETTAKKYFGCTPLVVSSHINLPIAVAVDKPEEVGADRIANAVAAHSVFEGEVIVVDFGTATTFDIIDATGAYIGGVIIPGPETSMKELARRAARLFEVRIERPEGGIIGKTTASALKSGLFYGTVGQVDYIIEKIIEEAGFNSPTIIATGGLADGIQKHSRFITRIEPTLTLEGLRLIGETQSSSSGSGTSA